MYEGEHRPLGLILLFSIVSLGFFNFYWAYIVSYELKQVSGDDKIKPVFEGIASLLTLGIYFVFWSYKYGKVLLMVQKDKGVRARDYSFLYAVLSGIFLFPLVMLIIQKQLNDLWALGN